MSNPIITELINAFADKQQPYMKNVEALVQFGDEALQPLLDTLSDRSAEIHPRARVAITLGRLGNPKAIKPLINALSDESLGIVVAAVLREFGKEVLPLVLEVLVNGDSNACWYAAHSIVLIGETYPLDEIVVEPLLLILNRNNTKNACHCAVVALGYAKDQRALEPLIKVLEAKFDNKRTHPDTWSRLDDGILQQAAWSIGKIGGERATSYLLSILNNKDHPERAVAAFSLGYISGDHIDTMLINALSDTDQKVQQNTIFTIKHHRRSQRFVDPLTALLHDTSLLPFLRGVVVEALAKIGGEQGTAIVADARDHDESDIVRSKANYALKHANKD
jgi:HEAT repeat protein